MFTRWSRRTLWALSTLGTLDLPRSPASSVSRRATLSSMWSKVVVQNEQSTVYSTRDVQHRHTYLNQSHQLDCPFRTFNTKLSLFISRIRHCHRHQISNKIISYGLSQHISFWFRIKITFFNFLFKNYHYFYYYYKFSDNDNKYSLTFPIILLHLF